MLHSLILSLFISTNVRFFCDLHVILAIYLEHRVQWLSSNTQQWVINFFFKWRIRTYEQKMSTATTISIQLVCSLFVSLSVRGWFRPNPCYSTILWVKIVSEKTSTKYLNKYTRLKRDSLWFQTGTYDTMHSNNANTIDQVDPDLLFGIHFISIYLFIFVYRDRSTHTHRESTICHLRSKLLHVRFFYWNWSVFRCCGLHVECVVYCVYLKRHIVFDKGWFFNESKFNRIHFIHCVPPIVCSLNYFLLMNMHDHWMSW